MSKDISKFEHLSDDILMDIFDSLCSPVHIYHSFFDLNQRLNRIISDSRLLMLLDLNHLKNPLHFAFHCQIMLPHMSTQLISLRLSNDQKLYGQIKIFLSTLRLSHFQALRQLSLIQITFDQLRRILAEILTLNKLIRLDIDMFDGSGIGLNELNLVCNALLNKSRTITSLALRFNRELVISEFASPLLRHLALDACLSGDVPQLFRLCSNLHSLTLKVEQSRRRYPLLALNNAADQLQARRQTLAPIICSHLTRFSLDMNDLSFADVKLFLSAMPYLVRLSIEGLSYDMDFANGDLWQKTFEMMTTELKRFDMAGVRIWLGNNADDEEENAGLVNQVTTSFGTTHKYWGTQWSVYQGHKLRPNHLNITLCAKALPQIYR